MRIIIGIVVILVIVGGLFWFMSGDSSNDTTKGNSETANEVTESSSIQSEDQIFSEIDNALEGLE